MCNRNGIKYKIENTKTRIDLELAAFILKQIKGPKIYS